MISVETEMGCRDLIIRCLRSLDARHYEEVAGSFAEDGVWERGGQRLVGPQEVRAALANRPVDLETQHIASNMIIDMETTSVAIVQYSLIAYAQRGTAPFELHAIFKAKDRLTKNPAGWRFLLRSATPAFAMHT